MNKINYTITARYFPAIICSLPIFILWFFFLEAYLHGFISMLFRFKWADSLTFNLVFVYLLAQLSRFIGKEFFEKVYFKNELNFPTTRFLLNSDHTFTTEYKEKIRKKIFMDFSIILNPKSNNKDQRKIAEVVGLIRERVKNGNLLLQHNIEYGFVRNLIGGAVVGCVISVLDGILLYKNLTAFIISIFLLVLFFLILISSKFILARFANLYAKRLYIEYLSKQ